MIPCPVSETGPGMNRRLPPVVARPRGSALLALLLAVLAACGEHGGARGPSLALDIPAGWTYVGAAPGERRGDRLVFDARTMRAALEHRAVAPLFALLKYAPPHAGHNPTFGITAQRQVAGTTANALALLGAEVEQARREAGFALARGVSATRVARREAATALLRAPGPDGVAGRVRLTLVVVDDIALLITASDAATGVEQADQAFDALLASLTLTAGG